MMRTSDTGSVLRTRAIALLFCASVTLARPDDAAKLYVGDPAPALDVLKWVKGAPVEKFKPGKVYVVEFWATWCVPCWNAMPHLSALQKKYAGAVTIIGVNARETERSDEAMDRVQVIHAVEKFVNSKGAKMAYTVAMDDPRVPRVFDTWMTAAGQHFIPTAFIVDRGGRIAWVGHPNELESNLAQTVAGNLDVTAARAKQVELIRQTGEGVKSSELWKAAHDAHRKQDYNAVLAEVQKVLASGDPKPDSTVLTATTLRLIATLHLDEAAALELLRHKTDTASLRDWTIVANEEGLSPEAYTLALQHLQNATTSNASDAVFLRGTGIAKANYRLGKAAEAAEAQQDTINMALADKEISTNGAAMDSLRTELATYRAAR